MQRLLNIRGAASNNQFEGNDSALSTDFNWDNISIGNDTLSSNNFFGKISFSLFVKTELIQNNWLFGWFFFAHHNAQNPNYFAQ